METHVLYRKYRPTTFREISGQELVVTTLTNALMAERIAHAYLFYGPRGTGKTTIARILARAVNCETPRLGKTDSSFDPCGKCSSCTEFLDGRALDLIEIDAASNTGVDDIRDLKEGIRFAPSKAKYKVFIIDEFHMLSKSAFNALLKTLEEPPAHVLFVLATTEIEKVPATILSRVQRFDFRKLTVEEIIKKLARMAREEEVTVEKEALALIAQNAGGALRDAESMFTQVITYAGKKVTADQVSEILGLVPAALIAQFAEALMTRNAKEALTILQGVAEQGHNPVQFIALLLEYMRLVMLALVDTGLLEISGDEFTKEEKDTILRQSKSTTLKNIEVIVGKFLEAEERMRFTEHPMLPLELAVIDSLEATKTKGE